LILAFIVAIFASMICAIPQAPSTEILVGSLARGWAQWWRIGWVIEKTEKTIRSPR